MWRLPCCLNVATVVCCWYVSTVVCCWYEATAVCCLYVCTVTCCLYVSAVVYCWYVAIIVCLYVSTVACCLYYGDDRRVLFVCNDRRMYLYAATVSSLNSKVRSDIFAKPSNILSGTRDKTTLVGLVVMFLKMKKNKNFYRHHHKIFMCRYIVAKGSGFFLL